MHKTLTSSLFFAAVMAGPGLIGCARDTQSESPLPERGLKIQVAPLELDGITDVAYGIRVTNALGAVVWERTDLRSSRFGDGRGALTYVGPCDASQNPNTVALDIENLYAGASPLDPGDWRDPTDEGPLTRSVTCVPNADTPVEFDLVIARSANQGFFDVAVDFADVFCSAKLDCQPELLHDPADGTRKETVVIAFACTSGQDEPTYLYLDDVVIACESGERYVFDPSLGPGNLPGQAPMFYGAATYRGREGFADLEKCYWNTALGIDVTALGSGCVLTTAGTASSFPFEPPRSTLPGETPANAVYPYIRWQVPLTGPTGALTCGAYALDDASGRVRTTYVRDGSRNFSHVLACGDGSVSTPGEKACAGSIAGLDEAVTFTLTSGGLRVRSGALEASYAWPDDEAQRLGGCCVDPCCEEPGPPTPQ